jgi:hypothetical protein
MKKKISFLGLALAVVLLPALVFAQNTNLPQPINLPGGNSNATVLDIVFSVFAGFAAVFSLFAFGFLIFNGFKLIIARENPELATAAKNGITWSVAGFVIAILSFSIIAAVSTLFGSTGINELSNGNVLAPPVASCSGSNPVAANSFLCLFTRVINGILGLSAIVAAMMIVYSGYRMIFSSGNPEQVQAAKTILKWAILGMVVIILSYTILSVTNRFILGMSP